MTRPNLAEALWKIYRRPDRPDAWTEGGNLPWDEPEFAARMLREHLDETHSAASRTTPERELQIPWLWNKLDLAAETRLLDVTCGPGLYAVDLARRGCTVWGVDFSPAAIDHAQALALTEGVANRCTFFKQDVREMVMREASFDSALFLYGQLAVFPKPEAQSLLKRIAQTLKPGGRLCVELLDQRFVDKTNTTWWYTDDKGLWGDTPFLHLGERFWDAEVELSIERFQIIHLETGELTEIHLCDQTYAIDTMAEMMKEAGFRTIETYLAWDGLPLYDASEWVVYVAGR